MNYIEFSPTVKPTTLINTIRAGLNILVRRKLDENGKLNPELDWEIRLYRYILHGKDPADLAEKYFKVKYSRRYLNRDRTKREAVAELGWDVR